MTDLFHPSTGPITAKALRDLADSPLDNGERVGKMWLPLGKRAASHGLKPVYECEFAPAVTPEEMRARRDEIKDAKIGALLTYYAGTTTPFADIANYLKLDMATVIRAMKARGREA